jgi:hypothetical protein
MHLVDKHMYPKNYFFAITREGIDGRRSLLLEGRESGRRRRPSASTTSRPQSSQSQEQEPTAAAKSPAEPAEPAEDRPAPDTAQKLPEQQPGPDQEMEDLSSAMSSLQFVPTSVRFGRGKKAGFARR